TRAFTAHRGSSIRGVSQQIASYARPERPGATDGAATSRSPEAPRHWALPLAADRCPQVLHQEVEVVRVVGKALKPPPPIELDGRLVFGVNQHRPPADLIRRCGAPSESVS